VMVSTAGTAIGDEVAIMLSEPSIYALLEQVARGDAAAWTGLELNVASRPTNAVNLPASRQNAMSCAGETLSHDIS
jgi:hypothetical protein